MNKIWHLTPGLTRGVYVHPSAIFVMYEDVVKQRTFNELPEEYQAKLATLLTCAPTTTITGVGLCSGGIYWLDVTRESWEAL